MINYISVMENEDFFYKDIYLNIIIIIIHQYLKIVYFFLLRGDIYLTYLLF